MFSNKDPDSRAIPTLTSVEQMGHQIYIVEDHPVMREGYAMLVEREMDLDICGETGSAEEARRRIPELEPDLILLDLSLEEGTGLELIKDLQAQCPDLAILVVSMHDETLYAERALQAGARGYLMKNKAENEVIKAIRRVLDGGIYLSEHLSVQLLMQIISGDEGTHHSALDRLSDRELEVFEYMGRGFTTREIAEALMLSPKTVDSYRTRVKEKLAINSNAELRRRAVVWVEQCTP